MKTARYFCNYLPDNGENCKKYKVWQEDVMYCEGFEIRTDLAVEIREDLEKKGKRLEGVRVEEVKRGDIIVTTVVIETDTASKIMRKAKGKYLTIDAQHVTWDGEDGEEMTAVIGECITGLITEEQRKSVLVVGLGNRRVTPDALGPQAVDNLCVNRHFENTGKNKISAIAPGVMAQTGIETAVLIKGIVNETKPTAVIVLDALAARSIHRLNTTVQLSDAGISPGSGVGNHRHAIDFESIGVPVVAIGIPTVVDALTIINDTMNRINEIMIVGYADLNEEERRTFVYELLAPQWRSMFVTPKNIDETIKNMSNTLAGAISYALLKKDKL